VYLIIKQITLNTGALIIFCYKLYALHFNDIFVQQKYRNVTGMRMKVYLFTLALATSLLSGEIGYAQRSDHQPSATIPCDSILSSNLLNSERIASKFGGYGIDVLYSSARLRVSNLYDGKHITRTLAIVDYPTVIDSAFSKEHQVILRGGSIGSTFKAQGWKIEKKNIFLGELSTDTDWSRLYTLMGIPSCRLSIWIYVFYIRKDDKVFPYATISEVYHPDYLSLADLKCINKDYNTYLKRTRVISHELKKITKLLRLDFKDLAVGK
jgi:hypothetical protein